MTTATVAPLSHGLIVLLVAERAVGAGEHVCMTGLAR
jgi:hypothetical protein